MSERKFSSSEVQDSIKQMTLSGDYTIPGHEGVVAYDSVTEVNGAVDDVWGLLSRWGLPEDGAAGLSLPSSTERWLPKRYHSLTTKQALHLPRLEAGNTVTDGPKGHKAIVREHTDEGPGQPKTLLFESHWPTNGWHYTYQFYVKASDTADTTIFLARTRWEGAKHPKLVQRYASVADEKFMQLLKSGLEERLSPRRDTEREVSPIASRRALAAGAVGGALVGLEMTRHTSNKLFKVTAPLLGAAAGYIATRRIASNTEASS